MKPKTLILMVVAVACGLAASFMTQRVLSDRRQQVDEPTEKVAVLVSRTNLSLGTSTKNPERLFTVKFFDKGEEPKKAIRTLVEPGTGEQEVLVRLCEQVKDRSLNKALVAEQWVSAEDLMSTQEAGLSAVMAKGMRALGVKVDTSAVAGGFVLPNSRVDIVWVLRRGNDAETTAKVLLQNVLVLAVGTIHQRPDDKQALLESTVTLAVTPEQAEKLTLAQEMGTLRLILRPFNDDELVKTSGVNPKNIGKTGDKASEDATGPDQIEDILSAPKADAWGQDKNALPQLPATPAPAPVPAPAEVVVQNDAPKTFTMMIHNGSATRRIRFAIQDENSETIGEEIRASTLPDRPAPAPKMETSTGSDK